MYPSFNKCQKFRFIIAVVMILLGSPMKADACLAIEEWQGMPVRATVNKATGIYLARFVKLEYVSRTKMEILMEVVHTYVGEELSNLRVRTDPVSAVFGHQVLSVADHSESLFWSGYASNTRLMGDCSFAPVEYHVDSLYLVLLDEGKINSSIGFERITDPDGDYWLNFVKCVLSTKTNSEDFTRSDAQCAIPENSAIQHRK